MAVTTGGEAEGIPTAVLSNGLTLARGRRAAPLTFPATGLRRKVEELDLTPPRRAGVFLSVAFMLTIVCQITRHRPACRRRGDMPRRTANNPRN